MRVVVDANVFVSAALSAEGAPARVVAAWLNGDVDVVVCPALIAELERVLARPRIAARVPAGDAADLLRAVSELAEVVPDPDSPPPVRARDPGDDYLIALAAREQVPLVSGDRRLLELAPRAPVLSPRELVDSIER